MIMQPSPLMAVQPGSGYPVPPSQHQMVGQSHTAVSVQNVANIPGGLVQQHYSRNMQDQTMNTAPPISTTDHRMYNQQQQYQYDLSQQVAYLRQQTSVPPPPSQQGQPMSYFNIHHPQPHPTFLSNTFQV
jgi:hypothetical protein